MNITQRLQEMYLAGYPMSKVAAEVNLTSGFICQVMRGEKNPSKENAVRINDAIDNICRRFSRI